MMHEELGYKETRKDYPWIVRFGIGLGIAVITPLVLAIIYYVFHTLMMTFPFITGPVLVLVLICAVAAGIAELIE
jgi:hypothetical protein